MKNATVIIFSPEGDFEVQVATQYYDDSADLDATHTALENIRRNKGIYIQGPAQIVVVRLHGKRTVSRMLRYTPAKHGMRRIDFCNRTLL